MTEPIEHEFPEHPIWRHIRTWAQVREELHRTTTNHVKVPGILLPDPAGSPEFTRSTWSLTSGGNALRNQRKGKWPPASGIYRERKRGWHLHVRVQDGNYRVELDNGNPDMGEHVKHLVDLVVRAH